MIRRRLVAALLAAPLLLTPAAAQATPAAGAEAQVTPYSGVLADGATWVADVPAGWNGTLVLYSHGFGTLAPQDAPDPGTKQALLDRGYALVGSSYDPNGSLWALESAVRDQFASLDAIRRIIGRPRLTLALGTSMGGLISAQEAQVGNAPAAEVGRGRIDGALSTCGLLGGGIDLNNYQLDGEHALSRLLGAPVKLVDYASPAEGAAAAGQLAAAATAAQATAAGRARTMLGTALLNMPTWSAAQAAPPGPRDAAGVARAQYDWLVGTLPFIMPSRYYIELAAGGNASWNKGVDYAALLARSPYRRYVQALYREAGLSLSEDLRDLTRHADTEADRAAVRELARTSTVNGHLDVPTLTLHTLYDQLAPVEYENRYAEQVRQPAKLRQAYVARRGHCAFTPAELVAALQALEQRVKTGRWGSGATAAGLQRAATALNLGGAAPAYVDFRPGPFVSHRRL